MTTSPPCEEPEPPLALELRLGASPERVWRAWTEPAELVSWLAEDARVTAEEGAPFELFWEPAHPERNSTLGCRVTRVEKGRVLAFEWRGPVPFAELMNADPLPTSVRVSLEPLEPGGTLLRLEHRGWGGGPRWREARAWQENAWQVAFARLARHLDGALWTGGGGAL